MPDSSSPERAGGRGSSARVRYEARGVEYASLETGGWMPPGVDRSLGRLKPGSRRLKRRNLERLCRAFPLRSKAPRADRAPITRRNYSRKRTETAPPEHNAAVHGIHDHSIKYYIVHVRRFRTGVRGEDYRSRNRAYKPPPQ